MANAFCSRFGVSQPIVLAPMGRVAPPELVAAVSNAGGLGLAPLLTDAPDRMRAQIRRIRALTDKPFGVNLNMDFRDDAQLDVCLEEGVEVISIFWGDPQDFTRRAKSQGAKVIITVGTSAGARRAAALGADAICAQGWEAGGHVEGKVSTMALVPAVVDAVGDVPVIAAGGIADGRGLAAAMALGASAAWIGTRFLAAAEAQTHPVYLERLLAASEDDTAHYDDLYDLVWPNAPHRALKNSTSDLWEAAGRPPLGERPGEGDVLATRPDGVEIPRYASAVAFAGLKGQIEPLPMWAGQGVGLVTKSRPAKEIVREIVDQARRIIDF
ncbi:NAD(P)H-dependent flavin oxidoreductase [Roseisalinus antarcticus]|uniref:Nitronate monooxygenase n=1 Tax=Roseisalinus antarcticus TaxID=254357 RepID=A0A1Y5TDK3_9RHOB|nr:nitronate monooxygenase [Roseisalinus antarcticus]SLN61631.1 Nitronate monooxygenase [Roseisalinus antarcticus]